MTNQLPAIHDPSPNTEILCNGPVNINMLNDMVTLTFTHAVADATAALSGKSEIRVVVRARIVMSAGIVAAFRDMLNSMSQLPSTPPPLSS